MNQHVQEIIAHRYKEIMFLLGISENEDNKDTPKRVAKALMEMTENVTKNKTDLLDICTTFANQSKGVTLEQDNIEFSSMCSHHHLPFFGKVRVMYKPDKRIIGLSKFNRIVDFYSRKPQVQEDFTREIADFLKELLDPAELIVEVYDCTHSCMMCRGVHSRATTKTKVEYRR